MDGKRTARRCRVHGHANTCQCHRQRSHSADHVHERSVAEKLREWNERRLKNTMIAWKRSHLHGSYEEYLQDEMPENVRMGRDGKATWIDPRVMGALWKGNFDVVRADDPLVSLGPLPSCSHGGFL